MKTAKELAQEIKDICFDGDVFMCDMSESLEEIVERELEK